MSHPRWRMDKNRCATNQPRAILHGLDLHPPVLTMRSHAANSQRIKPKPAQNLTVRGLVSLFGCARLYYTARMKSKKLVKEASRRCAPYCIANGENFRPKDFDPGDTDGVKSKKQAEHLLEESSAALSQMQEKLFAQEIGRASCRERV